MYRSVRVSEEGRVVYAFIYIYLQCIIYAFIYIPSMCYLIVLCVVLCFRINGTTILLSHLPVIVASHCATVVMFVNAVVMLSINTSFKGIKNHISIFKHSYYKIFNVHYYYTTLFHHCKYKLIFLCVQSPILLQ